MNILSWAALAVLVYYAFKGWRRGLIMTVFSMFATVIAIALAAQLSPQLSQNWRIPRILMRSVSVWKHHFLRIRMNRKIQTRSI